MQLADVAVELCSVSVPQQWIGSSMALSREVGDASVYQSAALGKLVKLRLMDFGTSEFNTTDKHFRSSSAQKQQTTFFWRQYVYSVLRMFFEGTRLYVHRFLCPAWRYITVLVFEDGRVSNTKFLGGSTIAIGDDELPGATNSKSSLANIRSDRRENSQCNFDDFEQCSTGSEDDMFRPKIGSTYRDPRSKVG